MSSAIYNPPSLNAAAQANIETGVLLLCKEALQTAIDDNRLDRLHLKVLSRLAGFINTKTAKAWPDRRTLAALMGVEPVTVSNKLRELRVWGYLIGERERVVEANNRSLMVYTFGNIDHETIRREIQGYIDRINKVTEGSDYRPPKSPPPVIQKSPPAVTVTAPGDYQLPKVTAHGARKSPPTVDSNSKKELNDKVSDLVASPTAQPTSRGTRLPIAWQLPKAWGEWTLSEFPQLSAEQVRQEGERFRDYWVAKAGKDATKLDWGATWRNWCRNSKWAAQKTGSGNRMSLEEMGAVVDATYDRMQQPKPPVAGRITYER